MTAVPAVPTAIPFELNDHLATAAQAAAASHYERLVDEIGEIEWDKLDGNAAALAARWLVDGASSPRVKSDTALMGARLAALLISGHEGLMEKEGKVYAEARLAEASVLKSLQQRDESRAVIDDILRWLETQDFRGAERIREACIHEKQHLHIRNAVRRVQEPLSWRLSRLRPAPRINAVIRPLVQPM